MGICCHQQILSQHVLSGNLRGLPVFRIRQGHRAYHWYGIFMSFHGCRIDIGQDPIPDSCVFRIDLMIFIPCIPGLVHTHPGIEMGPGNQHSEMNGFFMLNIHINCRIHMAGKCQGFQPDHSTQLTPIVTGSRSTPTLDAAITAGIMVHGTPSRLFGKALVNLLCQKNLIVIL